MEATFPELALGVYGGKGEQCTSSQKKEQNNFPCEELPGPRRNVKSYQIWAPGRPMQKIYPMQRTENLLSARCSRCHARGFRGSPPILIVTSPQN